MKHTLVYTLLLGLSAITACKKFVSIPPPLTEAETAVIFENEQAAIAAVAGLYSQMMQTTLAITNGAATLYPALSADELINTAANTDYDAFRTNNIITTTTGLNRLWQNGYRNIYHANALLEGLQHSVSLPDSLKKQLKGETLVARALNYIVLLNCFGDLPLVTSTSFETNQSMPRLPLTQVYEQLITDLLLAKSLLKEPYPSPGRFRPNKHTATALLARLYLYTQQWSPAEQQATEVISSGLYTLQSNLNNVFLTGSNEALWQLSPVSTTINTGEGNIFNPSSATTRPTFTATPQLLAAFEPGDQRKTNWLKPVTVSSVAYSYPYKYKIRTGAAPYTESNNVIRLAELYLIRAEARAQLNNSTGAIADINLIRQRAGLAALSTSLSQANTLLAVEQERRIELVFEWGHRWFDLKRWGKAMDTLAPVKGPSLTSTDLLYPLPQYEIEANPFLIQNPGY